MQCAQVLNLYMAESLCDQSPDASLIAQDATADSAQ